MATGQKLDTQKIRHWRRSAVEESNHLKESIILWQSNKEVAYLRMK